MIWNFKTRVLELLGRIARALEEHLAISEALFEAFNRQRIYKVVVVLKELKMSGVTTGVQAVFVASLLDNNDNPVALPAGSSWAFSVSDPTAITAPDPTDPTGATLNVTLPLADTETSLSVSASTVDPSGQSQTASITVTVTPGVPATTFHVSLVQKS